jgi:ADP-heptose:LPS heptosyltransferase
MGLHVQTKWSPARELKVRQTPDLRDFGDTAALCTCMQLVVSVDTSTVHLSGALGQRTWILLPFHPDWRWLTDRSDTPWYDSLRLFRQPRVGAWDEVLVHVSADLNKEFGGWQAAEPK